MPPHPCYGGPGDPDTNRATPGCSAIDVLAIANGDHKNSHRLILDLADETMVADAVFPVTLERAGIGLPQPPWILIRLQAGIDELLNAPLQQTLEFAEGFRRRE